MCDKAVGGSEDQGQKTKSAEIMCDIFIFLLCIMDQNVCVYDLFVIVGLVEVLILTI